MIRWYRRHLCAWCSRWSGRHLLCRRHRRDKEEGYVVVDRSEYERWQRLPRG